MQLPLFPVHVKQTTGHTALFSHDNVNSQEHRLALEQQYASLLEETDIFNRKLVSYQGNKKQFAHRWIKYKEAFSSELVEYFIRQFNLQPGHTILEPFAGSATTLLAAKMAGLDAVGIELLPFNRLVWEAKASVEDYQIEELRHIYECLKDSTPQIVDEKFPHIAITENAFPEENENDFMYYTRWVNEFPMSHHAKKLCHLILMSILEDISYTLKDGQYLRWDYRSKKVQQRNEKKVAQGKKPIKKVDKGEVPSVKETLLQTFKVILNDIKKLQTLSFPKSNQTLLIGSVLTVLPAFESDKFDAVITSPPYCNRYDYTRTYALELAYLNTGEEGIRALRQNLLSCTVENRSKIEFLAQLYSSRGQKARYQSILNTIQRNEVFIEINNALQAREKRGEINNAGILSMVEGYFIEMTFVLAEIFRTCRKNAHVVFVNDNVRYAGEVIPVDFLTTQLAEQLGFEPVKVYVLPQSKGNSSQQMGKFGRVALRKSITVWKKP